MPYAQVELMAPIRQADTQLVRIDARPVTDVKAVALEPSYCRCEQHERSNIGYLSSTRVDSKRLT